MDLSAFTVPLTRFAPFEEPWSEPIALIPLMDEGCEIVVPAEAKLFWPQCPVIGFGAEGCPANPMVDVVIERPFDRDSLARAVLANPQAAATLVQVLRLIEDMPLAEALNIESMAYAMLQGSFEHKRWLAKQGTPAPLPAGEVVVRRVGNSLDIVMDREGAGNAIDREMRDALREALSFGALDDEIEHITMRARGKAFCLGADLSEFGTTVDPATAHHIRGLTLPARAAIAVADQLHVEVDGGCIGAGLELAAFAHRITATKRSWFQLPELAMGIIPGAGGCVSVSRRIGRQRTALMVLSGRRIPARLALEWGLIDALVDDFPTDDSGRDAG